MRHAMLPIAAILAVGFITSLVTTNVLAQGYDEIMNRHFNYDVRL